jgi:hypothetical protein
LTNSRHWMKVARTEIFACTIVSCVYYSQLCPPLPVRQGWMGAGLGGGGSLNTADSTAGAKQSPYTSWALTWRADILSLSQ